MKRLMRLLLAAGVGLWLAGCAAGAPPVQPSPAPEPTAEPTAEPTPTAASEPTAEAAEPDGTPIPLEYLFDITVHPPTCVANGYSVYVSRESGGINIRDEVPRLPHEWVEAEVDGARVRVCAVCGTVATENN